MHVCAVLEEGQYLVAHGVTLVCFRGEMGAFRMSAGSQQEMLSPAEARCGQSAVPAGFLQAQQSRLAFANAEDPWQTGAQRTPGGPAFLSRNATVLALPPFPIIRCETGLCLYPFCDVLKLL